MHDIIALFASGVEFISEIYPGIWVFDTARYVLGAGGVYLIVNILLARALRNRKIRERSPDWAQMRRGMACLFERWAVRRVQPERAFGAVLPARPICAPSTGRGPRTLAPTFSIGHRSPRNERRTVAAGFRLSCSLARS